jgi:signal transduction histidine kinase
MHSKFGNGKAKEKAELTNRVTEFLSRGTHELRTSLNAIHGFAQLMGRNTKDPLPRHHKSSLIHPFKAGGYLLALTNDVFDIFRIDSEELSFTHK